MTLTFLFVYSYRQPVHACTIQVVLELMNSHSRVLMWLNEHTTLLYKGTEFSLALKCKLFSKRNFKVSVSRCFLVLSLNHYHSFLLVSLQKPTENKDNLLKGTIFWPTEKKHRGARGLLDPLYCIPSLFYVLRCL